MNRKILTACVGIFVWLMVLAPTGEASKPGTGVTPIKADSLAEAQQRCAKISGGRGGVTHHGGKPPFNCVVRKK